MKAICYILFSFFLYIIMKVNIQIKIHLRILYLNQRKSSSLSCSKETGFSSLRPVISKSSSSIDLSVRDVIYCMQQLLSHYKTNK